MKSFNKVLIALLPIFLICSYSNFAHGDPCRQDSKGNVWCAPPGGDTKTNNQNQVVCGVGQCLISTDGNNTVMCSSKPSGGAMFQGRNILCVGGCVEGQQSLCTQLSR